MGRRRLAEAHMRSQRCVFWDAADDDRILRACYASEMPIHRGLSDGSRDDVPSVPLAGLAGRLVAFVEHRAGGHAPSYLGMLVRAARLAGARTLVLGPPALADAVTSEAPDDFIELPDLWRAPRWRREAARVRFAWRALAEVRGAGADVVHWAHLDTIPVPVAWVSGAAPASVATLHRTYFLTLDGPIPRTLYRRWLVTPAFRRIARRWPVFVHDEGSAARLADRLRVRVRLVGYPVDVDAWPEGEERARRRARQRRAWGLGDDDVALLAFGATRVEKRLDLAVAALRQLPSNVRLVVEGAEDEVGRDEIVAWARAADVEGRALLHLARVDEARMPDVFAASDVVVAPYAPGFGGVSGPVSQAAAYGVPVVVSDLPELATGLRACGIGAFAQPGDAASVAEAVRSALAHPPTVASTARFREAHSEANFRSRMIEAYLEVLGQR